MCKETLTQLLDTMQVPESRKDLSKDHNVRWLARNLMIQNCSHPDILKAMELIRILLVG